MDRLRYARRLEARVVCAILFTSVAVFCGAHLAGCVQPPPRPVGVSGVQVPYVDLALSRITVTPAESVGPVGSTHILVATVTDACGTPLGGQRVEWLIERGGVGQIIAVDDGGLFRWWRGKMDNTYAVSYSTARSQRLTRGTPDPTDDICLEPGQTWCMITSAFQGATAVTAFAPAIADWNRSRAVARRHWIDVAWELPAPASIRVGTQHTLVTRLFQPSTGAPLAGYVVRHRILAGPGASFTPGGAGELEVSTDPDGLASATITQGAPEPGTNRLLVEIIGPDGFAPGAGQPMVIGRGEVPIQWVGSEVTILKQGPSEAGIGEEVQYTITVSNAGQAASESLTVSETMPLGMSFVRSEPPAQQRDGQLTWVLDPIPAGGFRRITLTLKAEQMRLVTGCAVVTGPSGLREESCVETQVTGARLSAELSGPEQAAVGETVTYQMRVTNTGTFTAREVVVKDTFDEGLEHARWGEQALMVPIGELAPGETRELSIELKANSAGRLCNSITVSAEGRDEASAEACTLFRMPNQ